MNIEPCVTEGSWGPSALYISHPPPLGQGFALSVIHTHTYNPVDRLWTPRRRAITSSEKGLNS